MKPLHKLFWLLGLLYWALVLFPQAAFASSIPSNPNQGNNPITKVSTFALPPEVCTYLQATFPDKRNDPNLCTGTHIEKSTITVSGKQAMTVSPASCFYGWISFQDEYVEGPWIFSTQLNTTFTWNGCSNPTVSIWGCYANYTRFGYSISDLGCSNYTTSIPSRAALQTGWANEPLGLGGFRFWQRRECYIDQTKCNWNWG
jgi:hypothetical protein